MTKRDFRVRLLRKKSVTITLALEARASQELNLKETQKAMAMESQRLYRQVAWQLGRKKKYGSKAAKASVRRDLDDPDVGHYCPAWSSFSPSSVVTIPRSGSAKNVVDGSKYLAQHVPFDIWRLKIARVTKIRPLKMIAWKLVLPPLEVVEARNRPSVDKQVSGKMISRISKLELSGKVNQFLASNPMLGQGKVKAVEDGKDNMGVGLSQGATDEGG
ncbi:unnamed protein product [Dovyalis caffra]|uniref:Uncharacterized protein n=1 Tax=Dovyalis caffra TaxID=77055 RepID=A0AAV1R704_9ROSI|nr:unnamed protein product [Dovyalis caffra]